MARLSLPLDAWPGGDRAAWLSALSPEADLLGTGGHAAELRLATRGCYEYAWGALLACLAAHGELDPTEPPEARLRLSRLNILNAAMRERGVSGFSRQQAFHHLYAMGRILAPHADLSHVRRPGGRALRKVIPGKPRPFSVRDVEEAMAQVRSLHAQALALPDGPARRQALRDAAFLGLLARRAPRVGSCLRMTIDHLRLDDDEMFVIMLPPEDTKTHRRLEIGLDAELSRFVRDYLTEARPRFPRAGATPALWLGMKGPLRREGLQRIVQRRTREWFGKAEGPHIFRKWLRHSAATRDPRLAQDSEAVMGHGPEVALAHYTAAQQVAATRRHADRLGRLRRRFGAMGARLLESAEALDAAPGMSVVSGRTDDDESPA